jgi:hypothetical protein
LIINGNLQGILAGIIQIYITTVASKEQAKWQQQNDSHSYLHGAKLVLPQAGIQEKRKTLIDPLYLP